MAILRERRDPADRSADALIYVFKPTNDPKGRLGRIVVRQGFTMWIDGRASRVNAVISATLTPPDMFNSDRYELLEGSL